MNKNSKLCASSLYHLEDTSSQSWSQKLRLEIIPKQNYVRSVNGRKKTDRKTKVAKFWHGDRGEGKTPTKYQKFANGKFT